ncbi:MAG: ketoacyl-ACP synthase III [Gemmatimonadaceae bacterium]|nr:ketoacyl-ACP synthase III [Gemmatimonadaceae bacterium]MCC6429452.1 ketoacyl-ACP synthase III [Gemmatimonadaceae bacterium]
MTDRVRMLGVGVAVPETIRTSEQVEARIAAASPHFRPRAGSIAAISGIHTRPVADDSQQCSDLAATAACRALADAGVERGDIDLLIFASASQDLLEPATANIVQEKLGTSAQVFDVKNACNSFVNGVQVAEAMILSGAATRALVTTGELCSRAINWCVRDTDEFRRNFPGYTMGDAGAAAVLVRSDDARGIYYRRFITMSEHWPLATIPAGGSMHPRGEEYTYLFADGAALKQAFIDIAPAVVCRLLRESHTTFDDFDRILIHQATMPYLQEMLDVTGIPIDRVELTAPTHGNMAAASLPVAFAQAQARGAISRGDQVLWLGLASGISVGAMMMQV